HSGDPKTARGFDYRVGRCAARILADEHIDLLALEQHRLRLWIEGTAPSYQLDVGRQRDIIRRVDRACDVAMMRCLCKGAKLQAAKAQENATWLRPQRFGSGFGARDGKPGVAALGFPGRADDRGERDCKP